MFIFPIVVCEKSSPIPVALKVMGISYSNYDLMGYRDMNSGIMIVVYDRISLIDIVVILLWINGL